MGGSSSHAPCIAVAVALSAVVLCGCGSQSSPAADGGQKASQSRATSSTGETRRHASTESGSRGATGKRGGSAGSAGGRTDSARRFPYSQSVVCYPSGKALVGRNLAKIPRDKLPPAMERPTIVSIRTLPNGKRVGTCIFGDSSGAAGL